MADWLMTQGECPRLQDVAAALPAIYTETNHNRLWYMIDNYPFLENVVSPVLATYSETSWQRLWYLDASKESYPRLLYENPTPYISYREAIDSGQRGEWEAEVYIDGETIPKDNIVSIRLSETMFDGDSFNVGAAASSYVEICLVRTGRIYQNKLVTFKIGFHAKNVKQTDFRFGDFFVTDVQHDEGSRTQTITAYDAMYFLAQNQNVSGALGFASAWYTPQTLMDIIKTYTGIELEDENCLLWTDNLMLDSAGKRVSNGKHIELHIPQEDVENATVRDIIARIARVTGTNAVFNRNNKLEFRQLRRMYQNPVVKNTVTKYDAYDGDWKATVIELPQIIIDAQSRYYNFSKEDVDARIVEAFVECGDYSASTRLISAYPYGTGITDMTYTLSDDAIVNSSAAIEVMHSLYYHNMEPLGNYIPGNVEFIGDPSLQVGDVIAVQDMDGKMHSFPIMQNIIEYDGGIKNTCTAYGNGYNSSSGCYTGPTGGAVSGIYAPTNGNKELIQLRKRVSSLETTADSFAEHIDDVGVHTTAQEKEAWNGAVEIAHVHANKYVLDSVNQTDINDWNAAVENAHEHSNKDVLDAIEEAYTTADKKKLDGIEAGANKITVDTALSTTSTNPVQNKVITSAAGVSKLINQLTTGGSTPTDADYYVCQYAGGGTTTTTYHRRPMSALWAYIKSKASSVFLPLNGTAAAATKLATARKINGVAFDGSSDITVPIDRARVVNDASTWSDTPWHKIASASWSNANTDCNLVLLISRGWGISGTGILKLRVRSGSDKLFESGYLTWIVAEGTIKKENFVAVYTNDAANGKITVELWMKVLGRYDGYNIVRLADHYRHDNANRWTLHSSTAGSASYTSGTGTITSVMSEIQNTITDTTDSGWKSLILGSTGSVRYRKVGKLVEIHGQYKPANSGGGFTIGTLPEGYRPSSFKAVATLPNPTCSAFFQMQVSTDGALIISGYSASTFTAGIAYSLHLVYLVD